jgi:succinoglycan biosynthesis transport protein ExoP
MSGVLMSRLPLIGALVVAAAVGGFVLSSLRPDQYTATATMRVLDPNADKVFADGQLRVDPARDVETQLQLLRSDDLRADVDQALGEAARVIDGVSVSAVGSTDLISISVTSQDPQVAADAANAFASIYVQERMEQVASGFTSRAEELRSKAADLDTQIRAIDVELGAGDIAELEVEAKVDTRQSLMSQRNDLLTVATQQEVEAATRSGNVEVAETASVPTAPSSPDPVRDAVLAAGLALALGIGLAFLLDRLDDKVHTTEDVERIAGGVPVIGAIPVYSAQGRRQRRISGSTRRTLVPLSSTAAESYRALRSNLRFSAVGVKRTTILLTSSEGSEGKSTVAANLAVVLAESGLRVVLVSADLRKPTLSSFFGVPETELGLTSVLVGDASLVDSMRMVTLASGRSLYVLPAGPLPQNPAEVLGSQAMRDVLQTIERAGADFILVDSPPILPVADALALSQFSDGVLVLTVAGRTPNTHLLQTVDRLRQVNAEIIGIVMNGIPTKGRYARSYGGYTYGYRNSYVADTSMADVSGPVDGGQAGASATVGGIFDRGTAPTRSAAPGPSQAGGSGEPVTSTGRPVNE